MYALFLGPLGSLYPVLNHFLVSLFLGDTVCLRLLFTSWLWWLACWSLAVKDASWNCTV